ncbi:MAG: M23 family metallopeptidase, partial [Sphingobacteriia bacterium]
YRHLQQAQVHPGQYVRAGQQIALSGKSGLVRGPHLHFTIWKEGKVVDPMPYIVSTLQPQQAVALRDKSQMANQSME